MWTSLSTASMCWSARTRPARAPCSTHRFPWRLVSHGLGAAVEKRTRNFQDLVWGRPRTGLGFQLAVEFVIPAPVKERLHKTGDYQSFRYEIEIKETDHGVQIASERGLLMRNRARRSTRLSCGFRNIGRLPSASCTAARSAMPGQYCNNFLKMDVHTRVKHLEEWMELEDIRISWKNQVSAFRRAYVRK